MSEELEVITDAEVIDPITTEPSLWDKTDDELTQKDQLKMSVAGLAVMATAGVAIVAGLNAVGRFAGRIQERRLARRAEGHLAAVESIDPDDEESPDEQSE